MHRRTLWFALLFAAAPLSAHDHDHAGHAMHAAALEQQGYTRSEAHYRVPGAPLVDQSGERVYLNALLDAGPVVVSFIYTSCTTVCPVQSATLAEARKRMAASHLAPRYYSISIDPEHDTPARLASYAEHYGAGPDWRFLTGNLRDVIQVQRAFGAWRGDKMNHTPLTLLRAGPGKPWVRLEGFTSAAELVREMDAFHP